MSGVVKLTDLNDKTDRLERPDHLTRAILLISLIEDSCRE